MQNSDFWDAACAKSGKSRDALLQFLKAQTSRHLTASEIHQNFTLASAIAEACKKMKEKGRLGKHIDPKIQELISDFMKRKVKPGPEAPMGGKRVRREEDNHEADMSAGTPSPHTKYYHIGQCMEYKNQKDCISTPDCEWHMKKCYPRNTAIMHIHDDIEPETQPPAKFSCRQFLTRDVCPKPPCEWRGNACQRQEKKKRVFRSPLTSLATLFLAANVVPLERSGQISQLSPFADFPPHHPIHSMISAPQELEAFHGTLSNLEPVPDVVAS